MFTHNFLIAAVLFSTSFQSAPTVPVGGPPIIRVVGKLKGGITKFSAGTPFTVKVSVKEAKVKLWEVPDVSFVWRG